jgi:hypothetical protein
MVAARTLFLRSAASGEADAPPKDILNSKRAKADPFDHPAIRII